MVHVVMQAAKELEVSMNWSYTVNVGTGFNFSDKNFNELQIAAKKNSEFWACK